MKNYKIAVLSDLGSTSENTLKNAISLAKIVGGNIKVFSVRKANDVVQKENQLSAMRTINSQSVNTVEQLKNLVKSANETNAIEISTSYAFGNVKNEILNFIDTYQPDVVVLGKRKANPFKLFGDNVTQFVFDTFKGAIMIASKESAIDPSSEISMGMLNNQESLTNLKFADDLLARTKKPLKSFKILKNENGIETHNLDENKKTVEYVFEYGDNSIKNLPNYLNKNNIDLLYLDRAKKQASRSMSLVKSDIKNLIKNLKGNVLVTPDY